MGGVIGGVGNTAESVVAAEVRVKAAEVGVESPKVGVEIDY